MILSPYNPAWITEFAALQSVYAAALGHLIMRIEHVGSTAVPLLRAKPILDIDIVIENYDFLPQIVERLSKLGYQHSGNQGILHREAFKPADDKVPYTLPHREWMRHHLYVCPVYSAELHRHIAFRDSLRIRADWRREYEKIKESISIRSNGDRRIYAQIKEVECRNFVELVLNETEPNQALEPTRMLVTDPAAQAPRQAPVRLI